MVYPAVHSWGMHTPCTPLLPHLPGYTIFPLPLMTDAADPGSRQSVSKKHLLGSVIPAQSGQWDFGTSSGLFLLVSDSLSASASRMSLGGSGKDRIARGRIG